MNSFATLQLWRSARQNWRAQLAGDFPDESLGMTAPLMALAVPLLDTGVSIVRRFLRQQPVFAGDAGHIHHRLLARGLTPRRVALLLYGACGLAAAMSLLASVRANQFAGMIIVLFCGAAWIGVQHLGYVEFGVAGRMFVHGAFRRQLNGQIALQALAETLTKTQDPQAHWMALCEICRNFGFTRVDLRANGNSRSEVLVGTNGDALWSFAIPLADHSFLYLMHGFGGAPSPAVLMPLAEVLHKNFRGGPLAGGNGHTEEHESAAAFAHAIDTWANGGLAEDHRRAPRLRLELPVHVRWRDMGGRQFEAQGMTRDLSKNGIYFTAPADVNTQQTLELALKLPEEIMPDSGFEVRYLTQSVRKEKLNGTNGFTSPVVGVAARFLTVPRGAGKGGLAA